MNKLIIGRGRIIKAPTFYMVKDLQFFHLSFRTVVIH